MKHVLYAPLLLPRTHAHTYARLDAHTHTCMHTPHIASLILMHIRSNILVLYSQLLLYYSDTFDVSVLQLVGQVYGSSTLSKFLETKLADPQWQTQLKTLHVVEVLNQFIVPIRNALLRNFYFSLSHKISAKRI